MGNLNHAARVERLERSTEEESAADLLRKTRQRCHDAGLHVRDDEIVETLAEVVTEGGYPGIARAVLRQQSPRPGRHAP
jgi:hypothetical protein